MKTTHESNKKWPVRCAFSLIELLVVLAIMSILSGLVIASVSRARGKAREALCLSNFRQFALGFELYSLDHQDAILPNRDGPGLRLGQTWVEGWLGSPGPDRANSQYLVESLMFPYVQNVEIWRCPAQEDPSGSVAAGERVRTVSLNNFMGSPVKSPAAMTYTRITDIVHPSPSDAITFVDERIDTINDGAFAMQWDFKSSEPGAWTLRDKPAEGHDDGGIFSFADGHAEVQRWIDSRTLDAPFNDSLMAGNMDILWMQKHATSRGQ